MSVTYATVNGRMVQENRGGVVTHYVADTLGSVIKTLDASGNVTSTTKYWPFGGVRTSTGTNPSSWGFVGTLGYFEDTLTRLYVRARTYRADLSRWMTVDPLWPDECVYAYVANRPALLSDPSGLLGLLPLIALITAGLLSCAAAAYYLYNLYARDIYPWPNDDIGHCMATCLLTAYLPWCALLSPWASECPPMSDCDWRDIWANTVGTGCGLSMPTFVKLWPPFAESYCKSCCFLILR
ncbi:MAG: hypothetical protein KF812_03965 [Fimbriimonadaceae bacterium]|nr:hypothetical protein [Fimbriimonadaceae bacterium]